MTNKRILTLITLLLFLFLLAGCWPWTINQPPEITSAPVKTATVGVAYTYNVDATDPNAGDVLTYSLISVEPPDMEINPDSGVITWTPAIDDVGDVDVTVEVSDGKLSDTQDFTITVTEAAPKSMEIIADMPIFTVGDGWVEFTVEIVANSDVGKNVLVYFTLPDYFPGEYSLLFFDETAGSWLRLVPGDHIFGSPDEGFPLIDEAMLFKVAFGVLGTYKTTVEVRTYPDDVLLCTKVITAEVVAPE